eukprot:TRINITY_DN22278_c0_g1_i2.p1 TRINITY_DN22278_c0_g1~~TRINITY_DN22278_c0_g1_i2.p1  ORF type:complete len:466 (-),score=51.41 TRINITY_DN22278_c0_g1_i2:158-1555(-)
MRRMAGSNSTEPVTHAPLGSTPEVPSLATTAAMPHLATAADSPGTDSSMFGTPLPIPEAAEAEKETKSNAVSLALGFADSEAKPKTEPCLQPPTGGGSKASHSEHWPPGVARHRCRAKWLPEGWGQGLKQTRTGNQRTCYVSPAGKIYYHKEDVQKSLEYKSQTTTNQAKNTMENTRVSSVPSPSDDNAKPKTEVSPRLQACDDQSTYHPEHWPPGVTIRRGRVPWLPQGWSQGWKQTRSGKKVVCYVSPFGEPRKLYYHKKDVEKTLKFKSLTTANKTINLETECIKDAKMSAFALLDFDTNQKGGGGTAKYRSHVEVLRASVARLHDSSMQEDMTQLLDAMEEGFESRTCGTYRVFVPFLLRAMGANNFEIRDVYRRYPNARPAAAQRAATLRKCLWRARAVFSKTSMGAASSKQKRKAPEGSPMHDPLDDCQSKSKKRKRWSLSTFASATHANAETQPQVRV